MRRALTAVVLASAGLLAFPATGSAALQCGLPEAKPTWIEYTDSAVSFWRERFGRPGVVIATGGKLVAAEARSLGAGTIHWDMYLKKRVGSPTAPFEPGQIRAAADAQFDAAVTVTGCDRPMIALNELWGGREPTPLTPAADQYRANVLAYVTRLAERGARPALLVSARPYTGGEAAAWWKAVSAVSDIVLEKYPNANTIWRLGTIDGSRELRMMYRRAVEPFLGLGIAPSRLGVMVGFQTGPGTGGREGLRPRSRWFDVAKWQGLAARHVAKELRLAHIWSWGWAQRNERSNDPDKTFAACVWLWARDAGLCDAPGELGKELDADVVTGQLNLPAGVRCTYGSNEVRTSSVASLGRLTRDTELALSGLVLRQVLRERARVSSSEARALEQRIVGARFGGNDAAYRSALSEVGAAPSIAREVVADELRTRAIRDRLDVSGPTAGDVARFRETYSPVLARRVAVTPSPSWLAGGAGLALATSAPHAVFEIQTGRRATIATAEGRFVVEALDDPAALGAVDGELARPAVVRELKAERRMDAFVEWAIRMQKGARSRLVCQRDVLPEIGIIRLSAFAPFLSLHEAEASAWASARRGSFS
jgi:hypothetical protein